MRGAGLVLACSIVIAAASVPGRLLAAPVDRTAWLDRVERARAGYQAFARKARLAVEAPAWREPTPPLRDPTLRDGDIIVRSNGLVVFREAGLAAPASPAIVPLVISRGRAHARELSEIARSLPMWRGGLVQRATAEVD